MTSSEEPVPMGVALRGRTVSDAMSGLSLTRDANEAYAAYTQEELEGHFARFKQYDLDNSGFITPANLKAILEALEMPDITDAQCANMIEEVAILVGHDNDGKLSFRDYCSLLTYEEKKKLEDEVYQAAEELRNSLREEPVPEEDEASAQPPVPPPAPLAPEAAALAEELHDSLRVEEPPEEGADASAATAATAADAAPAPAPAASVVRRRGSSFAVFDTIASSRIGRFEQVIQDVAAKEQTDPKAMYKQKAFDSKLAKFKAIETGAPAKIGAEDMHKKTLKAKLHAFEAAAKKEPPVAFKTSWKNVRAGNWQQKKTIAGGVAPKKSIQDWL